VNDILLHLCKTLSMFSGPKPKVSENAFEDLLGTHNFTSSKKDEPRTIKDMRREIDAKDMDPETLKVLFTVSYSVPCTTN